MRTCALLLPVLAAWACDAPSDTLFTPPVVEPIQQHGRFRVTANPGPDVVRGFTLDGRILYRSRGLFGFGEQWRMLSIPVSGGSVREEAGVYRAALATDSIAQLVVANSGRVLVTWTGAARAVHSCYEPAPAGPVVVGLSFALLEPADGTPLASVPRRSLRLPNVEGAGTANIRVRSRPVEDEVRRLGVDPYGPTVGAELSLAYFSDGEMVWAVDVADPASPAIPVVAGAFPMLSPDGRTLAVATPVGVDSTADTIVVKTDPRALGECTQETVTITATGWQVSLIDVASGSSSPLADGIEPRFHPDGRRLLVRRVDGLHWIDIDSGSSSGTIPGTARSYSPAISPDGTWIAFSAGNVAGVPDVFLSRGN